MSEVYRRKYLVTKPRYEVSAGDIKGKQYPTMTLMGNELISGCNTYIEAGWIYDMPDPNPPINEHSHDKYNEIVLHLGCNPNDHEDLGAEIEFSVDGMPLVFDKTSALFIPAGVKHGPLVWKRVSRPHLQIAIVLGAGSLDEADPGGHEKERRI